MTTVDVHPGTKNFEDITVVWLAPENEIIQSLNIRISIRKIINFMKVFTNVDECIDYISSIETEEVFLIISDSFHKSLLPVIQNIIQIKFVYIYCPDTSNMDSNLNDDTHEKVRGIFNDKQRLILTVEKDVSSFYRDLLPMSVISEKSIQDLNKDSVSFMWYWLLLEILIRMPHTEIAKREMINECRLQYENNAIEQSRIDNFENTYHYDNVIWWYTRDSFVYRLLNKALRTVDIDTIFKFRFIITDVYNQLHKLQTQAIQSNLNISTVYRGQTLSTNEFLIIKDNVNGLISMNTFLSTTLDKSVALMYAGDGSQRPYFQSILFEISINTSLVDLKKPFANIQNLSYFNDENEVLFSMGTIFRINSVEKLEEDDRIWNIKLMLSEEDDEQIKSMTEHLRKEMGETTSLLTLGKFLSNIGKYDQAEKYYETLLEQLPLDHVDIPNVYTGIGKLKEETGEYHMAITYYEKVRDMLIKNPRDSMLGYTYYSIGECYRKADQMNKALENYENFKNADLYSLKLENEAEAVHMVSIMEALGQVDYLHRHVEEAQSTVKLPNEEKDMSTQSKPQQALSRISDIKLRLLELQSACKRMEKEKLIRTSCNNAELYTQRCDYIMALNEYEKALKIESNPWLLTNIYDGIARTYEDKKDLIESIKYYKQALDIRLETFPVNYLSIARTYNKIGALYRELHNTPASLENYIKALELRLKFLPSHHISIVDSYADVAYAYEDADNYAMSLENYEKALNIILESSPVHKQLLFELYGRIAGIYEKMDDYNTALYNCEKALEIDCDIQNLLDVHRKIGHIYKRKRGYAASIASYSKALDLALKFLPLNDKIIAEIHTDLGYAYEDAGNYSISLENYEKALSILLESSPVHKQFLLELYGRMTDIYDKMSDYNTALYTCEKVLEMDWDIKDLAAIYQKIGHIHKHKGDYASSIASYSKELELTLKFLPLNDKIIAEIHTDLGYAYEVAGNYTMSLENFEKALNIILESSSAHKEFLLELYGKIDDVCGKMDIGIVQKQ